MERKYRRNFFNGYFFKYFLDDCGGDDFLAGEKISALHNKNFKYQKLITAVSCNNLYFIVRD